MLAPYQQQQQQQQQRPISPYETNEYREAMRILSFAERHVELILKGKVDVRVELIPCYMVELKRMLRVFGAPFGFECHVHTFTTFIEDTGETRRTWMVAVYHLPTRRSYNSNMMPSTHEVDAEFGNVASGVMRVLTWITGR